MAAPTPLHTDLGLTVGCSANYVQLYITIVMLLWDHNVVVSPFLRHRIATANMMAPIFACRFLIYSCTHYIHLHLQSVLQELLPTCSYHFGLGPGYLWVARRRSVIRSALCILFPQYPLHLQSVPWSATWGGAWWGINDNNSRWKAADQPKDWRIRRMK